MSLHRIFVSAIFVTLAALLLAPQSSRAASEVTMPDGLRIIDQLLHRAVGLMTPRWAPDRCRTPARP
jgi:hypothetical protein